MCCIDFTSHEPNVHDDFVLAKQYEKKPLKTVISKSSFLYFVHSTSGLILFTNDKINSTEIA